MEKEERTIPRILKPPAETEFFLQWGSRKRLRCVRVRGNNPAEVSSSSRIRRRITSRFLTLSQKDACFSQPTFRYTRNSEAVTHRSESRKSSSGSLEKEERCYTTRGVEENGKITVERVQGMKVWPKVCIGLSSKEKEEDFMAMKGCKLPQRPRKETHTENMLKLARGLKGMGSIESDSD
ncbi:UNVERIFIED_CONTAM: hypothetical protein Scaly_0668400 [Sesamum calycinum]|uniref:Uncharacterized protein n=1 Tax=Sesamum calycinum TaxID=2727403 RepID=A0AAW2RU85_9LAMI